MIDKSFDNKLLNIIPEEDIFRDEPMYKHTTFRVGGPAKRYIKISDVQTIIPLINLIKSHDIPYFITGNGSNLLVSDIGFPGVCLEIGAGLSDICITEENKESVSVRAMAGTLLGSLASFALKNSLSGFEFAAGIPGTVGGAMVMNAGAYGGEMKDVVTQVSLLNCDSRDVITLNNSEMEFDYRRSIIKRRNLIVLSADFSFKRGNSTEIKAIMDDLSYKRREKQPLEYPSAGSTFKRPEGFFAGKLIEDSGLKGYRAGGAQVSEKHSGFIINRENATAADIYRLIREVTETVYVKTGVRLEPEVVMLGEFTG